MAIDSDDTISAEVAMAATIADSDELSQLDDEELTRTLESDNALMHEERQRTRRVAPLMVILGIIAVATLPFFSGTPWAKNTLYLTLGLGVVGMAVMWWRAVTGRSLTGLHTSLAWGFAFAATCANTIYFGINSPAPVLMTMAVIIYAQGKSRRLALASYAAAALTQGIMTLLTGLDIIEDPGLVKGLSLSTFEFLAGQGLMQTLILAGYLLGRASRKASTEAIEKLQLAMREAARREVIAKEARENIRRALNIGGLGRLSGESIGPYRLNELIGQGGMGEIYKAFHTDKEQSFALKVIHPHMLKDQNFVDRFEREGRIASQLHSPFVVQVTELGVSTHGPWLAMELLRGRDLSSHLAKEGRLSLDELSCLAEQVGKAIDTAAEAGIVHRDIKPQNIFLLESAASPLTAKAPLHCKILDFGIARGGAGDSTLTKGSSILGTPAYMSPEQVTGERVDYRSDLHALAGVLYRAGTGFAPFSGENPHAIILSVSQDLPELASSRGMPAAMDAFFARAFAKHPDDRFQSGEELSEAFRRAVATAGADVA